MDQIQNALTNATMELLGHADEQSLLAAVPDEQKLPLTASHQDQINHAFAVAFGFSSVDEMLTASGRRRNAPNFQS
jgi:hypothetical protein